jgi:oxygen-independent coproporphyrinogen III oxidase
VGLDASSMLRAREPAEKSTDDSRPCGADLPEMCAEMRPVLRSKTTDNLAEYLAGGAPVETARLSAERQHEEAWFLGLRLHAGVDLAALEAEFGGACVAPARAVAERLAHDGFLAFEGKFARLTSRGRLLSNDVFQEFLGLEREMTPATS